MRDLKYRLNEPAFPTEKDSIYQNANFPNPLGLSRLEYFTALAMQGLLLNGGYSLSNVPSTAVEIAFNTIKEIRNKSETLE